MSHLPDIDNEVILVARLTHDPEFRTTPKGRKLAELHLCNKKKFESKDGTLQEIKLFIDVVFWDDFNDCIKEQVAKGDLIRVRGELAQENWEKDGTVRSKIKITGFDYETIAKSKYPVA